MLAVLIEIITNTIDSIIRLIKIFIQYARRLISSPVVRESTTIIFAPNQLKRMIQVYTVNIISGALKMTLFSAFTKIL